MEETLTCVCCGAEVHRDEVYCVGDQLLCRDCADEKTFICDNCGFRHWNSDNQGDDRYDLCPSCREEYFVACSECGRLISNSEAWYMEDDDDTPPYKKRRPVELLRKIAVWLNRPLCRGL